jgi:CAAX protease family protein
MVHHSHNGDSSRANIPPASLQPELADKLPPPGPAWLSGHPWVPLVVPFAVYMLCGAFEPTQEKPFELLGFVLDYSAYPGVYTAKILFTMAAICAVWPGYRQFPFRITPWAPAVGIAGVVLWIAICKLELETAVLVPLGLGEILGLGTRSAFNPLEQFPDDPLWAYGFLAIRFWGLIAVVPLIEEFFLRAFVMRFVIGADWWKIPFGTLTPTAIIAGTLVPVLMHPGEMFAAAVWFSLVTWLMYKTRNIWDCVVAHMVTNGLLGIWVVLSGDWYFM